MDRNTEIMMMNGSTKELNCTISTAKIRNKAMRKACARKSVDSCWTCPPSPVPTTYPAGRLNPPMRLAMAAFTSSLFCTPGLKSAQTSMALRRSERLITPTAER